MAKVPVPPPVLTPPAPAAATPPAASADIQVDAGGETRGERPGPKPAAAAPMRESAGVGVVSAADLNDRKWEAKKTALRALVQVDADKLAAETPRGLPVFGSHVDDEPAEPADAAPAGEPATAPSKPDELAAIAEKERENRRLKRELKRINDAPKGVDKLGKLKELAKTNPRGVAEHLGISLEALNLSYISGKDAEPIKLEDDAPKADPERERLERERDEARAKTATLEQRERNRQIAAVVDKMVTETKGENGAPRWGHVARVGDEQGQGRTVAMSMALGFVSGKLDEDGKPRAAAVRMKPLSNEQATSVLTHFLDLEETRLARIASKLAPPGAGKPQPRNPTRGPGLAARPTWDPRNPNDPNDPRNRPDYRTIGERHREKIFGRR